MKAWCIVIPFSSRKRAKYAAEKLKDYVVLDKYLKEIEIEEADEKAEYLFL
jgi:hypothetical protein